MRYPARPGGNRHRR